MFHCLSGLLDLVFFQPLRAQPNCTWRFSINICCGSEFILGVVVRKDFQVASVVPLQRTLRSASCSKAD